MTKMMTCSGPCGRTLPATTEYFYQTYKTGQKVQNPCKDCKKLRNAKNNTPQVKRLNNYGVTEEWFVEELERNHGLCAICQRELVDRDGKCCYAVDHNHDTGYVRGILCKKCNTGIGLLMDNADLCDIAANYLRRADERERKDRENER